VSKVKQPLNPGVVGARKVASGHLEYHREMMSKAGSANHAGAASGKQGSSSVKQDSKK
jgi:hypothetical protein